MKTWVKDGKTWAKLDDLQPWDQNPRDITKDALKILCEDLKEAEELYGDGQLIPLVTTTTGICIGGNQRMKAYRELGWTDIWINVIDAQNPTQLFKTAMRLNHIYGYTDEAEAARVASESGLTKLEMDRLFIATGKVKTIGGVIKSLGPDAEDDDDEDQSSEESGKGTGSTLVACPECGAEFERDAAKTVRQA